MKLILLIEDNSDIRENVCEMLELSGYSVICAQNGKIGIDLATENLPDLILSDVMMPELNGHEVFNALKKYETTKNIPFVFMTSSVEKKEIEMALNLGVNGYIGKPFEESELLETIEKLLVK